MAAIDSTRRSAPIHGRGSGSDWTLGCIALDDPAMKELFYTVKIGTPVIIEP